MRLDGLRRFAWLTVWVLLHVAGVAIAAVAFGVARIARHIIAGAAFADRKARP